jgi:excisionase family DNA binding protein
VSGLVDVLMRRIRDHTIEEIMRHLPADARHAMQPTERRSVDNRRTVLKAELRPRPQQDEPGSPAATAPQTEPAWITPRQAAAYLGVGVDTIYEACAASDLKHVKLGYRTIRLRREWIDRWAEKHASPSE